MKKILLATVLIGSLSFSMAQDVEKNDEQMKAKKLFDIKMKIVTKFDTSIEKLKAARQCVKHAKDMEAVKNCRPKK